MKLVVSRRAARRLVEIADYIHTHDPSAALKVRSKLQTTFEPIAGRPHIGHPFRGTVRRFVVPRLSFVILYRVDTDVDAVMILTVRHTARDETSA